MYGTLGLEHIVEGPVRSVTWNAHVQVNQIARVVKLGCELKNLYQ